VTVPLSGEQRVAVEHPLEPLVVIAGAGTGKTTVMAERILWAVRAGHARAEEVLALTFTNKAAGELAARVRDRLGPDNDVTVATYHSFAASLVAAYALWLDLHPRTTLLNRAQAWEALFGVFDELRFTRRSTLAPGRVVADALTLAERCANWLVDIETVRSDARTLAAGGRWQVLRDAAAGRVELCEVVAAYEAQKRARHLIDYGDQIRLAVELLERHPEVAESLRARYRVVLLDEYQDTNYAQRRMLQALFPPGHAITAVGDDMQSIYAFRGAHLRNLLDFLRHFGGDTRLALTVNRRAGRALVDLANRIQDQVRDAAPKRLRPRPDAPKGTVECFLAADDDAEAAEIARDIAAAGPPWSERAVLCRKRRLIPPIVAALEAEGVPVEVVGTSGLLDRPEVVDLVSWLEVLADPAATVALLRILRGPRYRIGLRDLAACARHAEGKRTGDAPAVLADALDDLDAVAGLSDEARRRLAGFLAEYAELAALSRRVGVVELAEAVIARTGLWGAAGERGRENLLRFLDLAQGFAPPADDAAVLTAFIEYLDLMRASEEEVAEAHLGGLDAVQVMTIHQAKGLEFAQVWVPGLGKGIFPDTRSGENAVSQQAALGWWLRADCDLPHPDEVASKAELDAKLRQRRLDEERRLLYVACTRAKERLVCSAAQWYTGPAEPAGPSEFYEFVRDQRDLVHERFAHAPPADDPRLRAMQRRAEAVARAAAAAFDPASRPRPPEAAPLLPPPPPTAPLALSVSALVSLTRCARQFHWSVVRPLPRPTSPAARLGVEVHRWIEERTGRRAGLLDLDDAGTDDDPDAPVGGRAGGAGIAGGLRRSFLASPYAAAVPERVEAPFVLVVSDRLVRGRVDAVYRRDGRCELVDFKTGLRPTPGDPAAWTQLELYALAAVDAWGADPSALRITYCYLRPDGPAEPDSRDLGEADVAAIRRRVATVVAAARDGACDPNPGPWCARCDFSAFCPAAPSGSGTKNVP
jgi:DNA helicase-2/ATP-dependent DNA helicase PcrA